MNTQIDTSIPVLTEIIAAPAKATAEPENQAATSAPDSLSANATAIIDEQRDASLVPKTSPASAAKSALGIRMLNANPVSDNESNTSIKTDSQPDWQALEQQVREAVLKQLLGRIDFVLEHRIRDNLADVLQVAVLSLTNDIRSGLEKTLSDVISRAVTQEINKLRPPK